MARKISSEEQAAKRKKELAILKSSNELLESAKAWQRERYASDEETLNKNLEQIDGFIELNKEAARTELGATEEELESVKYNNVSPSGIKQYKEHLAKRNITDDSFLYEKDISKKLANQTNVEYGSKKNNDVDLETLHLDNNRVEMPNIDMESLKVDVPDNTDVNEKSKEEELDLASISNVSSNISYDILPLPSNGECYPHKKSRVPVSYLTASDENIIVSPNLYRDGKVLDIILSRKIIDKGIDPMDLTSGDRDAILLWLRATGYGVDFPIKVRDPKSGELFETTIRLDMFKYKEFNLKGDENGWFEYKTDNGDVIKFKYLTKRELDNVEKSTIKMGSRYRKARLYDLYNELYGELDNDDTITESNKEKVNRAIDLIKEWHDLINEKASENEYGKTITDMMIAETMSVNGNTDREFIRNYVEGMRAIESRKYRTYMNENEPGVDMNFTVNRPESLGGGSFATFLEIDPFLFINIS